MYNKLLFCALIMASCNQAPKPNDQKFTGNSMTLDWEIHIADPIKSRERIEEIISKTFQEVNELYNRWNPTSEISKLNQLKAYQKVKLSPELSNFFELNEEFVKLSEGKFDPTIEPLKTLWRDSLSKNQEPSSEQLNKILPAIGWDKFEIKGDSFIKHHDQTSFNFGAIAKGYTVDLLAERLSEAGFPNVLVEWGGEIRALGHQTDKSPWKIWISDSIEPSLKAGSESINLTDEGIATSGDSDHFWTLRRQDGSKDTFFQLIDSKKGIPLKTNPNRLSSVTVIAPTCTMADAIATACMLYNDPNEAKVWAAKVQKLYPTVKFWFNP